MAAPDERVHATHVTDMHSKIDGSVPYHLGLGCMAATPTARVGLNSHIQLATVATYS